MGWSNRSTFQLLIINASGGFTGLFVYSPAPGTGNLIGSWTAAAGTDPYGNAYKASFTTYGAAGSYVNIHDEFIDIGSSSSDATPSRITGGGGQWIASTNLSGIAGDVAGDLVMNSKLISVSGNNSQALFGDATGGNPPSFVTGAHLEVQDTASGAYAAVVGAAIVAYEALRSTDSVNRWQVNDSGLTQWGPGGAAALDTRMYRDAAGSIGIDNLVFNKSGSGETWQSMNTRGYQNSWSDSGNSPAGRYRLMPWNAVRLEGSLNTPATPPDGQVVLNLPNAYHPANAYGNFTGRCIVPGNAGVQVRFSIAVNGNLTVAGASSLAVNTEVVFPGGAEFPLD